MAKFNVAEAVDRASEATSEANETRRRPPGDDPDVQNRDALIAKRLQQARRQLAKGNLTAAIEYAVQLAREFRPEKSMAPIDALGYLRRMNHPVATEFIHLLDEGLQPPKSFARRV